MASWVGNSCPAGAAPHLRHLNRAASGCSRFARSRAAHAPCDPRMKIENGNALSSATVRRQSERRRTGEGEFARTVAATSQGGRAQSAGVAGPAPVGAMDALLAVQAADDALQGRRRARARADDILNRLDDLRHFLLVGAIPRQRLEQLALAVRAQRAAVDDARLVEILDEIDLRAQVELAKLGL